MARDLADHEEVAALPPAAVLQFWLSSDYYTERYSRIILNGWRESGGHLHPSIVDHLDGRNVNQKPRQSNSLRPYSDQEWRQLVRSCTTTIAAARKTHRETLEAATQGQAPIASWLLDNGPASNRVIQENISGIWREGPRLTAIRSALYPDNDVVFAYTMLLALRSGIVSDGIKTLTVGNYTRTGPHTAMLRYYKGRTAEEALNLPRAAVRVLDQWLEHSRPLREHAGTLTESMWIYASQQEGIRTTSLNGHQRTRWANLHDLRADDGTPLTVDFRRIRATYHNRRDRSAWTGRATIDPNHSARIEGDHYLSHHTPAEQAALETVILDAQSDIRRKAEPPVIVTHDDAKQFAAEFPRLAQEAELNVDVIRRILTGEQDVFVAACASPLNSPYAPAGTLCPARPWVCLLCPLATFTPRHLTALLRLKEFFSRQAAQMTMQQFITVFGPYADRLDNDVLPKFDVRLIDAAGRLLATTPMTIEESQ
ncbi:hypothetical protein ACF9IK_27495 [Kitasatospora hibisci]|uniref:hypothetical protein n=1 Tax=Kitasatospora hibisci TaxID=3369522 RepID=UPI00375420AD